MCPGVSALLGVLRGLTAGLSPLNTLSHSTPTQWARVGLPCIHTALSHPETLWQSEADTGEKFDPRRAADRPEGTAETEECSVFTGETAGHSPCY